MHKYKISWFNGQNSWLKSGGHWIEIWPEDQILRTSLLCPSREVHDQYLKQIMTVPCMSLSVLLHRLHIHRYVA
jgi:hypothetical protein